LGSLAKIVVTVAEPAPVLGAMQQQMIVFSCCQVAVATNVLLLVFLPRQFPNVNVAFNHICSSPYCVKAFLKFLFEMYV